MPFGPGEPGDAVDKIVFTSAEALRMIGIMLQPFMPSKAKSLLDQLGVDEAKRTFEFCEFQKDLDYGTPLVELQKGKKGLLFPPLIVQD